ncbi:MAG TPA: leucyl/phenylalanyl-tRNA--protein transferase [Gammaproteobacteria bacterium]
MIRWLTSGGPPDDFPPADSALSEPNGLLAAGGDLRPERLLAAYRRGIFPWYAEGQPILWWSPDPRTVLWPERLKVSRSLRRTLARGTFEVTVDTSFDEVVAGCAAPRRYADGTWITPEMAEAYSRLHRLGWAHSFETRQEGRLVGGLYGVAIGRVFFGESMFSRATDASKVALYHLVEHLKRHDFALIDCQVASEHLARLGATPMPRDEFVRALRELCDPPGTPGPWRLE